MFLPVMAAQAQTVLTEEQQLEQAQKQLEEAQKALEIAKIKAQAAKIKAQADSIAKGNAATGKELKPVVAKEPKTSTSGWTIPSAPPASMQVDGKKADTDQKESIAKYLDGAVTTNNEGKIEFTLDTDCNGKGKEQIYDIVLKYMTELTQGKQSIRSRVALVNEQEHIIANTMDEWLVFSQSFISLDRTEFKYQLVATISDNHLHLSLGRIVYEYEADRSTGFKDSAENVISDAMSLNKKKTKLAKIYGKFRKCTIDRKDQIFNEVKTLVKQ